VTPVEIMLRCAVPDRPGALAELAGVIGATGADIEAVDVVDTVDGVALDDLVVVVADPRHLRALLDKIAALPDVEVVHAAPSRGAPGDAVTRLAVGLESVLTGAMGADDGLATLAGGLLRADAVEVVDAEAAPRERDGVLVVPIGARRVVVRRSYAFTRTERERVLALVRVCAEAARRPLPADAAP
jgi:acetolactate synthase regulatory subunit